MVKAMVAGDVLNAIGYRIRPYEVTPGDTDRALEHSKQILREALSNRRSVVMALRRCRKVLAAVKVDRLQPKPKVSIIGEFWAMTTEGAGNYHLQRFLESEGAEVDIQLLSAWLLYTIWQGKHDTRRRLELRGDDGGRKGLAGKDGNSRLAKLWAAEKILRSLFRTFAWAIGLENYHLPDMNEIARLAGDHYDLELRGGEGHMEVGKLMQSILHKKAHMVLSVKPFGCMPSSGVSDGVQSAVLNKFPDAIYCPLETTGDGEVNFQSRALMYLFKARRKAKEEFESALSQAGLTLEEAKRRLRPSQVRGTSYPLHEVAGTGANQVLSLRK
jgi:predicted nucleotide-binding protein (sugar kinase/HSP70/actin superfamily)